MAKRRGRGRKTERTALSTRVRRVWETVTTTLALLTAVYLILNTIEPTRLVLERYVMKLNEQALVAMVAIMLEVAIVAIYQLGRQVRSMRAELTRAEPQIYHDLAKVLDTLQVIATEGRRSERTVEILGLTLNTTWPLLAAWLTAREQPSHWRITLYCLDPAFVAGSGELPEHWAGEARRCQQRIRELLADEGEELRHRRVEVDLKSYACLPIVHGFRFGNGDLFISYLQWAETGGIRPFTFYERIPRADTSARANQYRDLFDNWLRRAGATAVENVAG
ncbi:hypothetical protein [Amycolatopsis nigrescens]|uniref:hypothetical protein n=1 Tax=Amycolatopsis nigrescens TaxID=381445 RepID=UPI0012FA0902|nr:hypothetical protein [Amycolatopsis nigrescens]